MNYIITMFLLFYYFCEHHLLYFATFCALLTLKITNKNIQQRTYEVSYLFPSINYGLTSHPPLAIPTVKLCFHVILPYPTFTRIKENNKNVPIFFFFFEAFRGLVRETASKGASGMSNPNTKTYARDRWT